MARPEGVHSVVTKAELPEVAELMKLARRGARSYVGIVTACISFGRCLDALTGGANVLL